MTRGWDSDADANDANQRRLMTATSASALHGITTLKVQLRYAGTKASLTARRQWVGANS
jgi:hypothetical protein